MLDPAQIPPVDSAEMLARFIIFSRHFRSSNNTVKPDAFIPHPQVDLSVTRHRETTEDEIWQEGERVAEIRKATLYGRADVTAGGIRGRRLVGRGQSNNSRKPKPCGCNQLARREARTENEGCRDCKPVSLRTKAQVVGKHLCMATCYATTACRMEQITFLLFHKMDDE